MLPPSVISGCRCFPSPDVSDVQHSAAASASLRRALTVSSDRRRRAKQRLRSRKWTDGMTGAACSWTRWPVPAGGDVSPSDRPVLTWRRSTTREGGHDGCHVSVASDGCQVGRLCVRFRSVNSGKLKGTGDTRPRKWASGGRRRDT